MSVIRVHKNKNFTVMSNTHLRDKNLSLKAKGLLSVMLSLPDDWNYSIAGLCSICKENETAVKSALNELKVNRYVIVDKKYPKKGDNRTIYYKYDVYEEPQDKDIQHVDEQGIENLGLDNQHLDSQGIESPIQINTDKENTKVLNTDNRNTNRENTKETNTYQKASTNVEVENYKAFFEIPKKATEKSTPKAHSQNPAKLPYEYTQEQLEDFLRPKLEELVNEIDSDQTPEQVSIVQDIILYFYQRYQEERGERHPILSPQAYHDVVYSILNPPMSMIEGDAVLNLDAYEKMIDLFFRTDYGKYSGNKTDYRISYFLQDMVRENLYFRAYYYGLP